MFFFASRIRHTRCALVTGVQTCALPICWLVRRPAGMARAYSIDLRERVVAAVEREGLSRHAAAARFGVAPSSAIKWVQRHRSTGSVAPGQIGGHKPRVLRGEQDRKRVVEGKSVSGRVDLGGGPFVN